MSASPSRYKITARGTDIELRGYIDGEATLRLTAKSLEGIAIVVASEAPQGWHPFAITEPEFPPTQEGSFAVITQMYAEAANVVEFMERVSMLHFMQANVIRGERYLREQAEAELRDRELHHCETEQINERLESELRELRG
jgi:hypothetical protein